MNRQTEAAYTIISEECEYTESYDDAFLVDSQGFEGRHTETCFSAFTEITISDTEGNKYSGYWWENTPFYEKLNIDQISGTALRRAVSQIGPKKRRSGRYRMVVDASTASRLISPILTALNASSIQQKMSFLDGSLNKKIFSEGMTLIDMARTPGKAGSRMYDTEGVATKNSAIIENGVVRQYFVNTYMAGKMGIEPTIEDISRPCMTSFIKDDCLSNTEKGVSLEDILKLCGSGIYVTGFNGGNCNPVTGDFSYGIEGFAFSRGKITHPVKEMLITGNLVELWNSLIAVGTDARECSRWQIPTLAFEGVSFSA
jgi:PmbA protein